MSVEQILERCLQTALDQCIFDKNFDASVKSVRPRFTSTFESFSDGGGMYVCTVYEEATTMMMLERMRRWREFRGSRPGSTLVADLNATMYCLETRALFGEYARRPQMLEAIEEKIRRYRGENNVFFGKNVFPYISMRLVAQAIVNTAPENRTNFDAFEFYPPCRNRKFGAIATCDELGRHTILYENGSFCLYRARMVNEKIALEVLQIYIFVILLLKLDTHPNICIPLTVTCHCTALRNMLPRDAKSFGKR